MLAVAFALDDALAAAPETQRVLARLAQCGVQHVLLPSAPDAGGFEDLVRRFRFPPSCIWYVTDQSREDAHAAVSSGMHAIWVDLQTECASVSADGGIYTVGGIDEVLDVLSEPYTRSALCLRYLLMIAADSETSGEE
jgi:hypothetical protein